MLQSKSSNESSIIDLSNDLKSNSSGNLVASNFVELDDFKNEFETDFENEFKNEKGCLKEDDSNSYELSKLNKQNRSDSKTISFQNQTLDYHPIDLFTSSSNSSNSSNSSSQSTSNLTDENSNECDSFLKSDNSQVNYFNRIKKKMKYKIKGAYEFWIFNN